MPKQSLPVKAGDNGPDKPAKRSSLCCFGSCRGCGGRLA